LRGGAAKGDNLSGSRQVSRNTMRTRWAIGVVLVASLANGVPSRAELFPTHGIGSITEDDLTGSGYETSEGDVRADGAARDDVPDSPRAKIARQWRDMAARARRQAHLLDEPERTHLLDLAQQYEARAKRLEDGDSGSS
jgi:hypothetical protein